MIWITAMSPFFPKCRLTLTVQAARQQKSFLFAKKGTIEKFFHSKEHSHGFSRNSSIALLCLGALRHSGKLIQHFQP